jgi:hypothetical protein
MQYEERFKNALGSLEPLKALNALVLEFSAKGRSKAEIYKIFEDFVINLRQSDKYREADEARIMEVMDSLTDWCHPSVRLLPDEKVQSEQIA